MNLKQLSIYYWQSIYYDLVRSEIWRYITFVDELLVDVIGSNNFTSKLLVTPLSTLITETILLSAILLLSYEIIYWSGIYCGLWEYHAKDIFTEIPVHCAHVYVRLNVAKNKAKVDEYYQMKQRSKYNLFNWKVISSLKTDTFPQEFVKYHFEFSPEDFESNPEPEYGSTIDHLRQKTLDLFNSSRLFGDFKNNQSKSDVILFNKASHEIGLERDSDYLAKCNIETGDVIDCVVLY